MKKTNKTSNSGMKSNLFRWIAVGAVVVLIAAFFLVSPSNDKQSFESKFMAQDDDINKDIMLSTRGANDEGSHASLRMIREGMEYYNEKEFEKAIPIFQEYLEKNKDASDYEQVEFYLAVSFLNQGETERCAKILEELVKVNDLALQEDAKWYLSLAYARNGQTDEAKTQLESLATSDKYGAKAKKILDPSNTKVAFR